MANGNKEGRAAWRLALLAIAGLVSLLLAVTALTPGHGPTVGQEAPPWTLNLYGGGSASSAASRGQVVVLHFWASWCDPCREEAPTLRRLWRAYEPQGVRFVGVSFKDVESKAQAFLHEHGLGFPNGADPRGRISSAYRVRAVPETYIIDRQGLLVRAYIGAVDETDFRQAMERALAAP
ncbi:MAG: TlpA family protein disulfide reductase [Chloroflexi bacterium]|nr:TlpA family protein disulfide reductase [Chloroflexota bacterium]